MAPLLRSLASRALLVVVLSLSLASCTTHHHPSARSSPSGPALTGTLRIAADSTLQSAVGQLVTGFVHQHPGVGVTATYMGSQALATALQRGVTADVVAFAGPADPLITAGLVVSGTAKPMASDPLVVAVTTGNPLGLTSLAALTGRGVRVALVDPSLPLGAAAQQALALAGVHLAKPTIELTAGAVVADLVSGTADAGLVGASDVAGVSGVSAVALPATGTVTTPYQIAPVQASAATPAAATFVAYVLSPAGQQVLRSAGFAGPGS